MCIKSFVAELHRILNITPRNYNQGALLPIDTNVSTYTGTNLVHAGTVKWISDEKSLKTLPFALFLIEQWCQKVDMNNAFSFEIKVGYRFVDRCAKQRIQKLHFKGSGCHFHRFIYANC